MLSEEELQAILKSYCLKPLSLKLDENGEIETNRNCLKAINKREDIEITKEVSSLLNEMDKSESCKIMGNSSFTNSISFSYFSNTNIDKNLNNIREELKGIKSIERQYIYFSVNYALKDLSFQELELKKINLIAESEDSDIEKAKQLYELFLDSGYFIPRKIYYGAIFYNKMENTDKIERRYSKLKIKKNVTITDEYNLDLNYNNLTDKDLNNIFKKQTTKIRGGNINAETLEEWKKSINVSNSIPIRFANLTEAKDILDLSLANKLKKPFQYISNLFKARKAFLEIIRSLKKEDLRITSFEGKGNFIIGICEVNKDFGIFNDNEPIKISNSFLRHTYHDYTKSFDGVIIGFKITDTKEKGFNATWTIKDNPLLSKNININFTSKLNFGLKYKVDVYYIKFPNSIEDIINKEESNNA